MRLEVDPADRAAVLARHPVSRETEERLDLYVARILDWQEKTNLVAPSTIAALWSRHVEDSMRFVEVAPHPRVWVDLGSGGGFPGIVIAILRQGGEGVHAHLVESNAKKAAFLRSVIRDCGLGASVHAVRIEASQALLGRAEAVSARALASLDALFGLVAGRIAPDVPCYFAKGRSHAQEILDASAHWRFAMVQHPSRVEPGSAILEVRDIARREASER